MIIDIPLPVKVTTNAIYAGMHWSKRKRLADEYHLSLIEYRGRTIHTPCNLHFIFKFKQRPLDCSNCSFMVKMLEDAMVHNKILIDDTIQYVKRIHITSTKGERDEVKIIAI